MLSQAKGATYTFLSREGGVQNFTGHPWPRGTERASEECVKSGQRGDVHICESGGRRTNFFGGHRGLNNGGEYS